MDKIHAEVKPPQASNGDVSSDEGEEEEYQEPASDYTALLQTLQATNETFAKAYAPRYAPRPTVLITLRKSSFRNDEL